MLRLRQEREGASPGPHSDSSPERERLNAFCETMPADVWHLSHHWLRDAVNAGYPAAILRWGFRFSRTEDRDRLEQLWYRGSLQALGKCMDITSGGTANGTKVQLYDCNGTGAQKWQRGSSGSLVNPQSGKCLDATGPSSANGTRLQIWSCTGAANQSWTLPS